MIRFTNYLGQLVYVDKTQIEAFEAHPTLHSLTTLHLKSGRTLYLQVPLAAFRDTVFPGID